MGRFIFIIFIHYFLPHRPTAWAPRRWGLGLFYLLMCSKDPQLPLTYIRHLIDHYNEGINIMKHIRMCHTSPGTKLACSKYLSKALKQSTCEKSLMRLYTGVMVGVWQSIWRYQGMTVKYFSAITRLIVLVFKKRVITFLKKYTEILNGKT